jgi:hypothetical protein
VDLGPDLAFDVNAFDSDAEPATQNDADPCGSGFATMRFLLETDNKKVEKLTRNTSNTEKIRARQRNRQ